MKPVLFSIEGLDHSGKLTDLELILNTKDEFLYLIEKKRNSISAYSISDSSNSNRLFRVTQLTELALNPAQADFQSNIFTFNNLISFAPPNQLNVISTLSRMITNRFKMYIYEDTIDSLLNEVLTPNEKPTAYIYGTLSDGELYLCIGTSQGNLIFIKLFIYESEDINFFICRQLTSEVVFMNLFSQTLICSSQSDELVLIRFSQEVPHVELKKVGVRRDRVVVLKEISSTVVKKISTTSKIERILSVVFLGEEEEQDDLIFEFCSNIVGLILENNQLTLLDLSSSTIVFEHRYGQHKPVGLYLDRSSEYLHLLFESGEMDIFNLNLGNIVTMIKLKAALLNKQKTPAEADSLEYQMKLFGSFCFTYERCSNLSLIMLNLKGLLKDYKSVYVDMRSFTKFTHNVLMNITQNGSIFEYFCQYYTNELISSHIEYQRLKRGIVSQRPNNLETEKEKKIKQSKTKDLDEAFQGGAVTLKDLNMLIEMQNKEAEEKMNNDAIPLDKIPLKLQNVVERNVFNLVKERMGESPMNLFDQLEEKGFLAAIFKTEDLEDGTGFTMKDVMKIMNSLNYSNINIFADPETTENCIMLRKKIGGGESFILNFYPPVYDSTTLANKNKISSMLFPFGVDTQSEVEFKAAFGDGFPTIEYQMGVQGIAESFSFSLTDSTLIVENNLSDMDSPRRISTLTNKRDVDSFTISSYVTTSVLLCIVSELIYVLKRGYTKVQPLITAIRTVFFERMNMEVRSYAPVSHKILTLFSLNDKLLSSASSHFILNNIYDRKKVDPSIAFLDTSIMDTISFFFIQSKMHQTHKEGEALSVLGGVSKFELFIVSFLLFTLKLKPRETSSIPMSKEDVMNMLVPIIEIKISISYPFLVIPVIKICLETLPSFNVRGNQKTIRKLFHSVAYFSLYYGLTFDPEDIENPTYINSSLLQEENLPSAKNLKEFVSNLGQQSYEVRRGIRVHILKLLKLLGDLDIEFVLHLLNEMISNAEVSKIVAYNVIDISKYMVKFCETDFNTHIVLWSEILMKSLNPNKPEIRKFCQKLATSSMKSLLKRYTFCAFHKDTQHFFVPGANHEIIIYDLRTAMRWKSLKGHDSLIEGLSVQDPGNVLASFSRAQKEIKLWKIGASGFFENLLKSSTELFKKVTIRGEIPNGCEIKMQWLNAKQIELCSPKVNWSLVVDAL